MQLKDNFTTAEIQALCRRSDLQAWYALVVNWGIISSAFALVAFWPNPLTIMLALILLGGRHLGLGVLMHECGHGTLFRSKVLNQWVGKWLCAGPVFYRIEDYMSNHLKHHAKAGSIEDPDLSRYQDYPVPIQSLRRKIIRDLTGRTSFNFLRTLLQSNGVTTVDERGRKRFDVRLFFIQLHAPILSNVILLAVLAACGVAELYLLWLAAYFSFYMVFSRIRNLAEHAVVPDLFDPDPLKHTRTTLTRWWERLSFAPNCVNYHLEHHLLPSVPKYRLAVFHRALKSRGLLEQADIVLGYPALMRKLVTQTAPT